MRHPSARSASPELDALFFALADPTRRAIIVRLRRGEATVGQLAEPHQMSLPAVSKHLRLLESAGLLKRRVAGRQHFISVNPQPLRQAANWIERQRQFWEASLDRLATLVETPVDDHSTTSKKHPGATRS
jgi:DNA-binding transcriptional ArsR family regulator